MNLVKWSEVSDIILLVINLPNFESKNVSIDEKSLHYHGISNGTEYQDTIHFLYEINTKKCSGKITENSLEFVIYKKIPCYWNSLTRTNNHLDNNWNNLLEKSELSENSNSNVNSNDLENIDNTDNYNAHSNDLENIDNTDNDNVNSNDLENISNIVLEEDTNDIENNLDSENEEDENDVIELDISNELSDLEDLSEVESDIELLDEDNLEEVSFD